MNWKLILELSLFGLAMGIATVFVIPSTIEPGLWLVIFLFCAWVIAKQCASKHFLHGLLLGLMNCVWITSAHMLLVDHYLANHAREAAMMKTMPMPDSPRLMMAMVGPVAGLISGIVMGLFAWVASKLKKRTAAA